jgi:hypothetical protein
MSVAPASPHAHGMALPEPFPRSPETTVAARWRRRLLTTRHWRTKAAYYRAVTDLLESRPDRPLTWRSVVAAVRPAGSRTTFYDVTGPKARHPLVREFIAAEHINALQIALRYKRSNAVEQLIDETKVWSYWPYRETWLCGDQADRAGRDALVEVVSEWARSHPQLASALDYAPPASAVEDLLHVNEGRLSPIVAYTMLALEVERALGTPVQTG